MDDFGLYVIITDPVLPHARIAEVCVQQGVRMLQVREKGMNDRQLLEVCRALRSITRGSATRLIVNDRPDIAALCDADGLHLGQEDLPLSEARRIVGPEMIIGLSTHSLAQARAAMEMAHRPDYIGFGPVYATPTKAKPDPVAGLEQLADVVRFSPLPVVAIGGIDGITARGAVAAGARNLCAVRYLMGSTDLEGRISHLRSLMEKSCRMVEG